MLQPREKDKEREGVKIKKKKILPLSSSTKEENGSSGNVYFALWELQPWYVFTFVHRESI